MVTKKIISIAFFPIVIFAIIYFESCGSSINVVPNLCNTGEIIKTSTSLAETLYSGTYRNLYGVNIYSGALGYISGEKGTILRTNNGGQNWFAQTSGVSSDLMSIAVLNTDSAVTVGKNGYILRTSNSGLTWDSINNGTVNDLNSVYFINSTTGFACGNGGIILKTVDGGLNWSFPPSGTALNLNCINFANSTTGLAVGQSGIIIKSTDAGTTWNTIVSYGIELFGVDCYKDRAFAVGANGFIVNTNNYGANWNSDTSNTALTLKSVIICMQKIAYAVGVNGTILFHNGVDWSVRPAVTANTLHSVHAAPLSTDTAAPNDINSGCRLAGATGVGNLGTILNVEPERCSTANIVFNYENAGPEDTNCIWCVTLSRGSACMDMDYLIITSTSYYSSLFPCEGSMSVPGVALWEQVLNNYVNTYNIESNITSTSVNVSASQHLPIQYKFYMASFDGTDYTNACYIQLDLTTCCKNSDALHFGPQ